MIKFIYPLLFLLLITSPVEAQYFEPTICVNNKLSNTITGVLYLQYSNGNIRAVTQKEFNETPIQLCESFSNHQARINYYNNQEQIRLRSIEYYNKQRRNRIY